LIVADIIDGLAQFFVTDTVNELVVDVKGVVSSTVDTIIFKV
jgi:hypothetical protein